MCISISLYIYTCIHTHTSYSLDVEPTKNRGLRTYPGILLLESRNWPRSRRPLSGPPRPAAPQRRGSGAVSLERCREWLLYVNMYKHNLYYIYTHITHIYIYIHIPIHIYIHILSLSINTCRPANICTHTCTFMCYFPCACTCT